MSPNWHLKMSCFVKQLETQETSKIFTFEKLNKIILVYFLVKEIQTKKFGMDTQ